ncbi:hypothetical protein D3C87_1963340 [compost metagenome]
MDPSHHQRTDAGPAANVHGPAHRLGTLLHMRVDHLRKTVAVRPEKYRVSL